MARSSSIVGNLGSTGLVIPSSGVFFGSEDMDSGKNFTGTRGIETLLGRRMAIRRYHYKWLTVAPTSVETSNSSLRNPRVLNLVCYSQLGGNFPIVNKTDANGSGKTAGSSNNTTVSGHTGMDRITAGEFDTNYWVPCARALAALADPVFVNLWYEFNGKHNDYYPGFQGGSNNTLGTLGAGETRYRNAWRYVATLIKSYAPNAIMCWTAQIPTSYGYYQNCYPGDDVVDIIAWDEYYSTLYAGGTNPSSIIGGTHSADYYLFGMGTGTGMNSTIATTLGRAMNVVKPMAILEAGYTQGQSVTDVSGAGGNGSTYDADGSATGRSLITRNLVELQALPNVIAWVNWNETGPTPTYVDNSPASLTQWTAFASDPYTANVYPGPGVVVNTGPTAGTPNLVGSPAPQVGTAFTADPNDPTWGGTKPLTYTYQWVRDGTNIGGATSASYTAVTADATHQIWCKVTGANAYGPSVTVTTPHSGTITTAASGSLSTSPVTNTPGFFDTSWTTTNTHAGRTWDGIQINGVNYVVGEYNRVDDNSGTHTTLTRMGITAIRDDTQAVITTWDAGANDYIYAVWPSADGTKLYVVGKFTTICGVTRHRVACLNVLSGPTDTSAASLNAIMPDLGTTVAFGHPCWKIVLDEANNRGWVSSEGGPITRIDLNAGAWRISSGWTSPSISQSTQNAAIYRIRAMAYRDVDGSVYAGGQSCSPCVSRFNPDTGAARTFTRQPSENPGLFDIVVPTSAQRTAGAGDVVYLGAGGVGGDIMEVTDPTGSGTQTVTIPSGSSVSEEWFFADDGNVQAIYLGVWPLTGLPCIFMGHHGNVCAQSRSNSSMPNTSTGALAVTAGTYAGGGGTLLAFNHPPDFDQKAVGGTATGSVLKVFGYFQGADGSLFVLGDFTEVNGSAGNTYKRYSKLQGVLSGGGTPVNTALPTITDITPTVGDSIDMLSHGTWTNSPGSYSYRIIAISATGTETTVATNAAFTVTAPYTNYTLQVAVIATAGSLSSAEARSVASSPVQSVVGNLQAPVIDPGSKPPSPTTSTTNTFSWTEGGTFDHFRYRIYTDGIVGAWQTVLAQQATVTTPAGHTYEFEVQAVDSTGNTSTSDTYTWSVTSVATPSAPTMLFTPAASGGQRNMGFSWTHSEGYLGYTWQVALATPANPTPTYTSISVPVKDYAPPLGVGNYTFHVKGRNSSGLTGPETTFAFTITADGTVLPPALTTVPPAQDTDNAAGFAWT